MIKIRQPLARANNEFEYRSELLLFKVFAFFYLAGNRYNKRIVVFRTHLSSGTKKLVLQTFMCRNQSVGFAKYETGYSGKSFSIALIGIAFTVCRPKIENNLNENVSAKKKFLKGSLMCIFNIVGTLTCKSEHCLNGEKLAVFRCFRPKSYTRYKN